MIFSKFVFHLLKEIIKGLTRVNRNIINNLLPDLTTRKFHLDTF